jgi:NTP pyrophosphatase (non-canonical NTP hydrolase)
MELNELVKLSHDSAKLKGFWDKERNVGELLMLIVSELGEALEAHRTSNFCTPDSLEEADGWVNKNNFVDDFKCKVKDTFQDEIADTVIRLMDLRGGLNIDIEKHIKLKMRYTETRPKLHGKKY